MTSYQLPFPDRLHREREGLFRLAQDILDVAFLERAHGSLLRPSSSMRQSSELKAGKITSPE